MKKVIISDRILKLLDGDRSILSRTDVRVLPVSTNEEALDTHRKEKADLIIADLDTSGVSGEQLCFVIRENSELCRVSLIIMHSGSDSERERAGRCRANAIIEKSEDTSALIERAHELLQISRRKVYRTPVGVRVEGEQKEKPFLGYSENISSSGMLIDAERALAKGDTIYCSFILPDSMHVNTGAEIVRIAEMATEHDISQYGVKFHGLRREFRSAIAAFVRGKPRRR